MAPSAPPSNRARVVATLINVFTVAPENQQRLVELLVEATERGDLSTGRVSSPRTSTPARTAPGSSTTRNGAPSRTSGRCWKTRLAAPHLQAAGALATFEPHLYEVMSVHHA